MCSSYIKHKFAPEKITKCTEILYMHKKNLTLLIFLGINKNFMITKFLNYSILLISATITAQISPLGELGNPQPMAGPVNPPGDLNTIVFDYDTAGNQIKRTMIYLAARPASNENNIYDEKVSTAKDAPLQSVEEFPELSYYPNPVKSQLYLKWDEKDGKDLQTMELYTMNGILLKRFIQQSDNDSLEIDFSSYPCGIYNLLLLYNSGEKKDLKIVKP